MKRNKIFIIGTGILAVLAVAFRIIDPKIAALLYRSGNPFGGLCETSGAALPFLICSFCFSAMIFCRHTRTSFKKNRMLNVLYGILTFISSAAAVLFPTYDSKNRNYYLIFGFAAVLTGVFIYLGTTLFKTNYQKTQMTKFAKLGIFSSLVSVVLYFAARLIPQRPSYEALQISMERYGNYDSPEAFVPFLALSGIGAALVMWFTCFSEIFPKLKFSNKYIFAFSVIWAVVMLFSAISSGHIYGSEFICGLIVSYTVQFSARKIYEKKYGCQ